VHGVDRHGQPTGNFVIFGYGLSWWQAVPDDDQFQPLNVSWISTSDRLRFKTLPRIRDPHAEHSPEHEVFRRCRDAVRHVQKQLRDAGWKASKDERRQIVAATLELLDQAAEDHSYLELGARALFWKGDLLSSIRDHEQAAKVFRLAAERYAEYPEGVTARIQWAEELNILGRVKETIEVLEAVRDAGADGSVGALIEPRRRVLHMLVRAYVRTGDRAKARQALNDLRHADPKNADRWSEYYEEKMKQ
jgi:tetratricopeptide (TPR) repeat protein